MKRAQFGPYELLGPLGKGRASESFRARRTDREPAAAPFRALKIIHPELCCAPGWASHFKEMARVATALRHPNIVEVYDFGYREDLYYMVTALVDGYDLAWVLERHEQSCERVPVPVAVSITLALCEGLLYAQEVDGDEAGERAVRVHGDLRPTNVLLSRAGRVSLTDFGLTCAIRRADQAAFGLLDGAYAHLTPEQLAGRPADQRADVFALGALLFEMTSGTPPFARNTNAEAMKAALTVPVVGPASSNSKLPAWIDVVLLKALAFFPEERYETVGSFADDLRHFAEGSCGVAVDEELAMWLDDLSAEIALDAPDTEVDRLTVSQAQELLRPASADPLAPEPALNEIKSRAQGLGHDDETRLARPLPPDPPTLASFDRTPRPLPALASNPQAEIDSEEPTLPPLKTAPASHVDELDDEPETLA